MPENKEFMDLTRQMQEIHRKKNDDYSSSSPDENFERVRVIQDWFNNPMDKSFVGFVAVKLARLGVLLSSQKEPNNESVEDSFLDLCTYCALWAANYKRRVRVDLGDTRVYSGSHLIGCRWNNTDKRYYCIDGCEIKRINDKVFTPGLFINENESLTSTENSERNLKSDPRIIEIFDIADKLTEDKLALLTAEARRLVM